MSNSECPAVLLVEDNKADVDLLKESFSFLNLEINLEVLTEGSLVTDFLQKKGSCGDIKNFDLIILDINLPGKNGFEILQEIKCEIPQKNLPVVILTSSQNEEDMLLAYKLRADAVFSKPSDFMEFTSVINSIAEKYLKIKKDYT